MSTSAEKQRWTCPGCEKIYTIAAGRIAPELCPTCKTQPVALPAIKIEEPHPPVAVPPPVRAVEVQESLADPANPKWKPLAVVLPQLESNDLGEASDKLRERRYYADLAWSVTRFWFVVLVGPAALSGFAIAAPVGFLTCFIWLCVFGALSLPASGALRE